MDMKLKFKMGKNKRGVSGVVTMVLMIALVIVAVSIVWIVVNNLINEKLENADSCLEIFEKVTLNNFYTCYNSSSNEVRFSINIGNCDINKLIVSISGEGTTQSYTLTNEETAINGLKNYPSCSALIKIPRNNSGLTYIASGFSTAPDRITIIPFVGSKDCGVSDSISEIENCVALI